MCLQIHSQGDASVRNAPNTNLDKPARIFKISNMLISPLTMCGNLCNPRVASAEPPWLETTHWEKCISNMLGAVLIQHINQKRRSVHLCIRVCNKPLYTHINGNMFMYLACTQFENSTLLGYYAACSGKDLPLMLCKSIEESRSHLHCGRSLKSYTTVFMVWLQARILVRHETLHMATILNRVVSNEGDKRKQIVAVGINRGMQQLRKAQAWVVDRKTQLHVDAVLAFFH